MRTTINGRPATWQDDIKKKFDEAMADPSAPQGRVVAANYFTPRPYRNVYDRGSADEGFVYTIIMEPTRRIEVIQVAINERVSRGR